jgi:hypothetical protein
VAEEAPDETVHPSRRTFLTGAAGLTGVALAVGAWKPVFAMEEAPLTAAGVRPFGPVKIALTLGETGTSFLSYADGGNAFGDVVNEKEGPAGFVSKHIGGVKWGLINIKSGADMSKAFFDWVSSSISSNEAPRMNGAIDATDNNLKVQSEMTFFNALITEIGFPALDAASKDAAKMSVKFQPQFTRISSKTGGTIKSSGNQKVTKWLSSNFKLTLDGVDTSHVTKIDAFTFKQNVITNADGVQRDGPPEVPNFKLRVPAASAQDFIKWHQDFVIDGNNGQDKEKTGSISYLNSDLKTEIFRLDLGNVGIFDLEYDPLDAGTDSLRQVTVQLYAETMKLFKL